VGTKKNIPFIKNIDTHLKILEALHKKHETCFGKVRIPNIKYPLLVSFSKTDLIITNLHITTN